LNCISIMMSFLTYITGFFMNFELLPILTDYEILKKGGWLCLYSSNFDTFWLKIEQFWPFEEISIFSNGSHLGYRTALTDTFLKGTHPGTIPARFGLIICWNDSWVVLFQNCVRHFRTPTKMATTAELNLTWDPMGNSHKNLLVWNNLLNKNKILI
jgi:hypothetical protein